MTDEKKTLVDSLLPSWDTDHEGFDFGDLVILIFDFILLIYTGWRSYDILSKSVPSGWEIMGMIGLVALDIGAIVWSYIWIFNSSTKWQDRIAMTFFVIDMSGVALTSITDSLLYGDADGVMYALFQPIAMIVIPVIIISNVIAGIVYHFTSNATKSRRMVRQLKAKAAAERLRQTEEELKLQYAQDDVLRKQKTMGRRVAIAKLRIEQERIERETQEALEGGGHISAVASADGSQADLDELNENLTKAQALSAKAKGDNQDSSVANTEDALQEDPDAGAANTDLHESSDHGADGGYFSPEANPTPAAA